MIGDGRVEELVAKPNICLSDTGGNWPSQQSLREFVEWMPNAILGIGEDGAIVLVNAQAGTLFGYASEELYGEPRGSMERSSAGMRERSGSTVTAPRRCWASRSRCWLRQSGLMSRRGSTKPSSSVIESTTSRPNRFARTAGGSACR